MWLARESRTFLAHESGLYFVMVDSMERSNEVE
jgi:hypothetical protein